MSPLRVCLLLKIFIIQTQTGTVFGQYVAKGSLAFVIDNTYSMTDDIEQVKDGASQIFHTVLQAKHSQIQNYVVVTFNDPDAEFRINTEDKSALQDLLSSLKVTEPNLDCPENAMKGIELGLTNSLPFSYIYVFTDATAKDYREYERVKRIYQQKQSQIVFALTGDCYGGRNTPEYQVYHRIAEDTSGQVFHLDKNQVTDILNYVKETVTGRRYLIASVKFSPGRRQKFNFTIDSKTGSATIAVSGFNPNVTVFGPDGVEPQIETIVNTEEAKIVKLTKPKPGTYYVEVGSDSNTSVVVTGKTDIHFQHGFSPFAPTSINDTVTRPAIDGDTFLSIKLIGEGVTLQTVTILNMDNTIFAQLPLETLDEKEQFYCTKQFSPPNTAFRIEVVGYDVYNKKVIRRAQTSIERLSPTEDDGVKVNMAPEITIPSGLEMTVEYEAPLKLMCRVHAYPKPTVIWQEMDTGLALPIEVHKLAADDHMAILDVKRSVKNCTYQCKASNAYGEVSNNVAVVTKQYFNVIEIPQNQTIEYNTEGHVTCKIHALPSASITWYKDEEIIYSADNIVISDDGSVITIKQMQLNLTGNYKCQASNKLNTKEFHFYIGISGVEIPKIERPVVDVVHARRGTNAELTCRLVQGKPKSAIRWEFLDKHTNSFRELQKYTEETIEFRNVTTKDSGSYKCVAENIMGSDQLILQLIVEYPPTIQQDNKETMLVKYSDMVLLLCSVDGVPSPTVKWYKNDTKINDIPKYLISEDNSIRYKLVTLEDSPVLTALVHTQMRSQVLNYRFKASLNDIGNFTCKADNRLGTARTTVHVDVYVPVTIETPDTTTIDRMVGSDAALGCTAHGYPEPIIQWLFRGSDSTNTPVNVRFLADSSVLISTIQIKDEGAYICTASNVGGAVNLTYTVNVIAAPAIQNMYTSRTFDAVVDDMALRIQCNASGRPKPTIYWIKDGTMITFGTDRYDKDEDGTLIINDVTRDSQGIYVCRAENNAGKDSVTYVVNVKDYPKLHNQATTPKQLIEEGSSCDIECPIPHETTDRIRWYKNGRNIRSGELKFNPIRREDAGYYTCRVSNSLESRSAHKIITIGSKPVFITEEKEDINDLLTPLVCVASGDPIPTIEWRHNGIGVDQHNTTYILKNGILPGKYECIVSNEFGSVHRAFDVKQSDCVLDTANDFFTSKQPLLGPEKRKWPFNNINTDGNMVINNNTQVHLYCPNKFNKGELNSSHIAAYCVGGKIFNVKGIFMKYSEIECTGEIMPVKRPTTKKCLGRNNFWQIGFRVIAQFYPVYDICISKKKQTVYTVHKLKPGLTRVSRNISKFDAITDLSSDKLFDCENPTRNTNLISDKWCFENRQLVNYRDLHPNIPVTASYDDWNLIPRWRACNSKNWDEVENRVRLLATDSRSTLTVLTGAFGQLQLSDNSIICSKNRQPVAQYLWKVVVDSSIAASLAIVQVNVPELLFESDATPYVLCEDICSGTKWMNSTDWHDVTKGYVYCCNVQEFDEIIKKHYKANIGFQYRRILFDARISK